MQLTIDTVAKTIKIKDAKNLGEIMEELQKMLPDWKEYKLESEPAYFPNPVIPFDPLPFVPFVPITPYPTPTSPWQPYQPQQPTSPYQPYTPQQPWTPYYPQSPIYHQREPYTITCRGENIAMIQQCSVHSTCLN